VVGRCRKLFGQRQVGHAGTLDPDATGVLLVGLGRATRLLRFLSGLPKSYVGEVVLGVATSTLDSSGSVVARYEMGGVGVEDLRRAAAGFVGEVWQVPPMVSAVKVGGRRLHELARAGEEVERAARRVVVHRLAVEPGSAPGVFRIEVDCSSGTYIRSLAADLGEALGGGAHLRNLRRTAVGPFDAGEAVALDQVGAADVLPPREALRGRPSVAVDPATAAAVAHGAVLDRSVLGAGPSDPGPWAVLGEGGDLLAVYEPHPDGRAKPAVVLA
jgi:tRNA pseudouridine55 synthase